jgi:hypothetical protein
MDGLRLEEYKFLRQEHENNRRFVFERPLVIVGATLAAAFSLSEKGLLGLLPVPFLAVLLFNLWFTFNRMESSARIVAYIQLVLEPSARYQWMGWESSLRAYRAWVFEVEQGRRHEPLFNEEVAQVQAMGFYAPIFYFHLALGILVTAVLVSQSEALQRVLGQQSRYSDLGAIGTSVAATASFGSVFWRFRPSKLRHLIEWKCQVWREVLDRIGPSNTPLQPSSGAEVASRLDVTVSAARG